MKIGFYDSGLGGLSVLQEFLKRYGSAHSYIYLGDSARAPYGTKARDELVGCVYQILDFMQERKVDLVVSACNTSSMYLDVMNLGNYNFQVLSLFEAMKKYFLSADIGEATLLATPTTIASQRYKEWNCSISPVACPDLVPLVEAGNLVAARARFLEYLAAVKTKHVIIGCTHYSFLVPSVSNLSFIDPAKIVGLFQNCLEQGLRVRGNGVDSSVNEHAEDEHNEVIGNFGTSPSVEIYCTGNAQVFSTIAQELLGSAYSCQQVKIN